MIIDLEADSSEESDGEPPAKQTKISGETKSGSYIGSLDSFLKAARQSVEVDSILLYLYGVYLFIEGTSHLTLRYFCVI